MAGTQPEHPMILGNCISCNGLMRVPVTTDVTHVARCPHCEIRFPVQQLIASAIPAAEIIEGVVSEDITPVVDRVREQSEEKEKTRTKFEVPKQLHDGAKHRRRRRRRSRGSDERKDEAIKKSGRPGSSRPESSRSESSRSNAGAAQPKINAAAVPLASTQSAASADASSKATGVGVLDEVPMPQASASPSVSSGSSSASRASSSDRSSVRSSDHRSSSRRSSSRQEEEISDNPVVEVLKIGIGGMLALPLAYLGMMWIAGLDPFSIADQINKFAPILVPDSMVVEGALPLTDEDEIELDEAEGLPTPSIDPDEIRG